MITQMIKIDAKCRSVASNLAGRLEQASPSIFHDFFVGGLCELPVAIRLVASSIKVRDNSLDHFNWFNRPKYRRMEILLGGPESRLFGYHGIIEGQKPVVGRAACHIGEEEKVSIKDLFGVCGGADNRAALAPISKDAAVSIGLEVNQTLLAFAFIAAKQLFETLSKQEFHSSVFQVKCRLLLKELFVAHLNILLSHGLTNEESFKSDPLAIAIGLYDPSDPLFDQLRTYASFRLGDEIDSNQSTSIMHISEQLEERMSHLIDQTVEICETRRYVLATGSLESIFA